jgi:PfaD family protein
MASQTAPRLSVKDSPLPSGRSDAAFAPDSLTVLISSIRERLEIIEDPVNLRIGLARETMTPAGCRVIGQLAPMYPEWLGDRRFSEAHSCRFPYVVGEMARGLSTPAMVIASAKAGFCGFYGAAGLDLDTIRAAIREIASATEGLPSGTNLIHTPNEPDLERATVELYLGEGVRRISASAFMALTPNVVHYSYRGAYTDSTGRIVRPNQVLAKVSRPEVAAQFMAPPPKKMVQSLVREGRLTRAEGEIAQYVPVAEDVTAEADSGGHTDNRPLAVLLPLLQAERDRVAARLRGVPAIRIGAAGGLGTPAAVAAAFAMGAAYVLTGTINQTVRESGLSETARQMLVDAGMADVAMAPSADMFELGVKVQVLRKGSLYAQRAGRLFELYRTYRSVDEIPTAIRRDIEREIFGRGLEEVEDAVRSYFSQRKPDELRKASEDGRHKMALIFRWYLGMSSRWPITGQKDRQLDYQIWCGPAIGAFNEWVRGSFLADLEQRSVAQVGLNLLEGAAIATRAQQARIHGMDVPASLFNPPPRRLG